MSRRFHGRRTFLETARNRRSEQLFGVVRRKVENAVLPRLPIDVDAWYERRIPSTLGCHVRPFEENTAQLRDTLSKAVREEYRKRGTDAADGVVTLLNETRTFRADDGIAWVEERLDREPLLWRLKLEGFVHFGWPVLGFSEVEDAPDDLLTAYVEWFRTWRSTRRIADRPGFLRRDWIPHSVSLRILNWSRFLAWGHECLDDEARFTLLREIGKNAAFLADHVEYDLDGNHLVENALALTTAGVLTDTDRWCERGCTIFQRCARTQILDDGGHFERSPMYHTIVTTRFLTAVDLLERSRRRVPTELTEAAAQCVTFLRDLQPPDGRLPLLHDSVHGESLSLDSCLDYARSVGIDVGDRPKRQKLPDSGYYWLGDERNAILGVGGEIALPHLPGHAHVHPGHVSLYLDRKPVLVDTGVYTYTGGAKRTTARSIRSHNTVQVGSGDPVTLAGSFLMGDPIRPRATFTDGPITVLTTEYDAVVAPDYSHRRSVFHADEWWLVWDQVRSDSPLPATARYHCHPSVSVDTEREYGFSLRRGSETVCHGWASGVDRHRVTTGEYYPEFGTRDERAVVEQRREPERSHSFGTLFTTSGRAVSLEGDGGVPDHVVVGDDRYALPTDDRRERIGDGSE